MYIYITVDIFSLVGEETIYFHQGQSINCGERNFLRGWSKKFDNRFFIIMNTLIFDPYIKGNIYLVNMIDLYQNS